MKDHRLIDERSLAFAHLVAEKIMADPRLVELAQGNLRRWLAICSPRLRPALLEWQAILEQPLESILAFLLCTDERAARLRQSSPFAGLLSHAERTSVILEYQRREKT